MTIKLVYLALFLFILCKGKELNVYMVVNSHLDAGWLATFDQYYLGQGTPYGESAKRIYDNLIGKLESNSKWTYTISEVCFFYRWWNSQTPTMQERVRKLIKNKQLEFVNGGWVAHDEATPTYEDMLENLAQGSVWLRNTFGIEVNIGWQLDSFGTCSTHASLLAQAGYRILFFSRLDFMEREKRRENQEMEFIWRPPNPLNQTLLTHIFGYGYEEVPYLSRAQYISQAFRGGRLSDKDFNDVESYLNEESKVFRSPNILLTIVGDFYQPANDYQSMQSLVDHFSNTDIDLKFSTLTKFADSLYKDLNLDTLPTKNDDFYPYIQLWNATWSGFFSSKPSFKALVRATSHYLNAIRSLNLRMSFTLDDENHHKLSLALTQLGQVLSIVQHHDAITGTSKEKVRRDYESMITKAVQEVENELQPFLSRFVNMKYYGVVNEKEEKDDQEVNQTEERILDEDTEDLKLQLLLDPILWSKKQLNQSQNQSYFDIPSSFLDSETEEPWFYVFSFNPGMNNEAVISLSLPKKDTYNLRVEDSTGTKFSPDVFCLNIPYKSCNIKWVDEFAKLETKVYKIIKDSSLTLIPIVGEKIDFPDESGFYPLKQSNEVKVNDKTSFFLLSDYQTLILNNCLPNLAYEEETIACHTDHILLKYMYYTSSQSSGAYVFNPDLDVTKTLLLNNDDARVYIGQNFVVLEIFNYKVTSQLIFQISNSKQTKGFEVISLIDGSIGDELGCEIVLSLSYLDLMAKPQHPFYVDANGYFLIPRIYGEKDNSTGPSNFNIARNFYPMTTMMAINDTERRMTVITDRAQGVTQLPTGEIEIMIHRITKADDDKGVREFLDEKDLNSLRINVTTRHFVLITDAKDSNSQARLRSLVYEQPLQLWKFEDLRVINLAQSLEGNKNNANKNNDSKNETNLNFMKLNTIYLNGKDALIRLQNIHDKDTFKLTFCNNNTSLSSTFLKILGSPTTKYKIQNITEQHLTNFKTLSTISCAAPLEFLPQEMKVFQIEFDHQIFEEEEEGDVLSPIMNDSSSIDIQSPIVNDSPSVDIEGGQGSVSIPSHVLILVVTCVLIYVFIGIWIHRYSMSKHDSTRVSGCGKVILFYILFGFFWPCMLIGICLVRSKSKKRDKLLEDGDIQFAQ